MKTKNIALRKTHGRLVGFLFFLLLTFTLYALVHVSVLVSLRSWFPSAEVTYTILALWLTSILSLFIARRSHNAITNFVYRLGVGWMGISLLLFLVLFPATIVAIMLKGELSPILLVPILFLTLAAFYLARSTKVKELDVALGKLPKKLEGFRIVQLTDIHIGEVYGPEFLQSVVNKTNKLKPDLIVITGDVFDGGGKLYEGMVDPLKELKARNGVYYVRGNHEVYEGIEATDKLIKQNGIQIIDDDVKVVQGLSLVGLSYPSDLKSDKREMLSLLAKKAGAKKPRILLRHEPRDPEYAAELGFDLMLSGHTHNGQLWPLSYLVSLAYPYRVGSHRIKQMTLYIGPGIGTWGPPFRLGSRSEITVLTLRRLEN